MSHKTRFVGDGPDRWLQSCWVPVEAGWTIQGSRPPQRDEFYLDANTMKPKKCLQPHGNGRFIVTKDEE